MHEFQGWFSLAESTEESDAGTLQSAVDELAERLHELDWATGSAQLLVLNGEYYLRLDGLVNRMRDEATDLDRLLNHIATRLPGSYGILFERSDEMPFPPGPDAFRVRCMARGQILTRLDPFLSPCNPVIED
jgi:Immunity protein 7